MTAPDSTRRARILLGTAFTGAGIAHVVKHEWLFRWRKPISAITAVIQIVGGISMFVPQLRVTARWTNLAMLCRPCRRRSTRSTIRRYCARPASLRGWPRFASSCRPSWPR